MSKPKSLDAAKTSGPSPQITPRVAIASVSAAPQPESDGRTNLVNFERVRRYLDVSRATLLRYVYDRKIAAIKMDGGWRFRWEDVERFIQRRMQKAA